MKFIVKFANDKIQPEEIEADGLVVQNPGVVVLHKNEQMVGMFPIPQIAGVFTPDGPNKVVGVEVAL